MDRKLALLLSLLLTLILAGCGQEDPTLTAGPGSEQHEEQETGGGHVEDEDQGEGHEDQGTKEIGGETATYHGSTNVSSMDEFELEADDSYFGPTVLEGEPGQKLTLAVYNEGEEHHTFTIDEAGIDEDLPAGADGISFAVTFPDSDSLVFYCRFHRAQGMLGALSVDGSVEASGTGGASETPEGPGYG